MPENPEIVDGGDAKKFTIQEESGGRPTAYSAEVKEVSVEEIKHVGSDEEEKGELSGEEEGGGDCEEAKREEEKTLSDDSPGDESPKNGVGSDSEETDDGGFDDKRNAGAEDENKEHDAAENGLGGDDGENDGGEDDSAKDNGGENLDKENDGKEDHCEENNAEEDDNEDNGSENEKTQEDEKQLGTRTEKEDGSTQVCDQEEWSVRLARALSIATPRSFATADFFGISPNPLLVVRNDELNLSTNSGLDPESGVKQGICMGLPLSRNDVRELQNQRLFVSDKKMGLDIIPSKFITLNNKEFTSWVREGVEVLSKKLEIEGIGIELNFGFVLDEGQEVSGFGNSGDSVGGMDKPAESKLDKRHLGNLLVVFPGFEIITVTLCSRYNANKEDDVSPNVFTAHYSPATTMLTLWLDGAVPTIASAQSMLTPALCLVYTVYISQNEIAKRGYEPWQLRIQHPNAATADLKKCLNDWISRINNGEEKPYLPWILDQRYQPGKNLSGKDAARRDKIMQVAKDLGLQVYLVRIDITQTSKNPPSGWIDPDDCDFMDDRNPSPELEDPDVDENDKFYWENESEVEEQYKLSKFYDLQRGCLVHESEELMCTLPSGTTFAQPIEFTTATPGLEQIYEKWGGTLVNKWKLSALVFWPFKFHVEVLVNLFEWDAAFFLGQESNSNAQIGAQSTNAPSTTIDSVALATRILAQTNPPKVKPVFNYQLASWYRLAASDEHASRAALLEFALGQRRADLFHATLKKLGRPKAHNNAKLIHQALIVFADRPEIIMELAENYANITYWLDILEQAKSNADNLFINTYLPRVSSAHKPSVHKLSFSGNWGEWHYGGPSSNPADIWTSSTTCRLLGFALSVSQLESAFKVLRAILKSRVSDFVTVNIPEHVFFATVLEAIQSIVAKNSVLPNHHPSIQHFFQGIWLKHILPRLSTPPSPDEAHAPTNFTLPAHKCTTTAICGDCNQLSSFLVNKDMETWTNKMSVTRRKHIKEQLDFHYPHREYVHVEEETPPGRIGSLTVSKIRLKYADRIQTWEAMRVWTEAELNKFGGVFFVNESEENWWGTIRAAVSPGGQGFTKELALAAKKFLTEEFPVGAPQAQTGAQVDASSNEHGDVIVTSTHFKRKQEEEEDGDQATAAGGASSSQQGPAVKRAKTSGSSKASRDIPVIDLVNISDSD